MGLLLIPAGAGFYVSGPDHQDVAQNGYVSVADVFGGEVFGAQLAVVGEEVDAAVFGVIDPFDGVFVVGMDDDNEAVVPFAAGTDQEEVAVEDGGVHGVAGGVKEDGVFAIAFFEGDGSGLFVDGGKAVAGVTESAVEGGNHRDVIFFFVNRESVRGKRSFRGFFRGVIIPPKQRVNRNAEVVGKFHKHIG